MKQNALMLAKQLIEAKKQRENLRNDYENYYDEIPRFEPIATTMNAAIAEISEEIERLEAQLSELEAV